MTRHHKMALAGVVVRVLSGVDVEPRAKTAMSELRRRTVSGDRARIADAVFVRVRRDVRHFFPFARGQSESHLRAAGFDGELAHMARGRRAQKGHCLLRARCRAQPDWRCETN